MLKIGAFFGFSVLASSFFMGQNVYAGTVPVQTTFSVKWIFTSAGNSCGGFEAKHAQINTTSVRASPTSFDTSQYSVTAYKSPSGYADGASWTGSGVQGQYDAFAAAGTNVTAIWISVGFVNHQGASCPAIPTYCYTGHNHQLNYSTSAADCGQWIPTTITDCGFSSAQVWVRFLPNTGCPTSPTPTPTPGPVVFNPNSSNIGTVANGNSTAPMTVTITNSTGSTLSNCTFAPSDTQNFIVSGGSNCRSFAIGASCNVSIQGRPMSTGRFNSSIVTSCSTP